MANFDYTRLEQLQDAGDWAGAKAMIKGFFETEVTAGDIGEVYARLSIAYIRVSNEINQKYSQFLAATLDALKKVDQAKNENDKQIDIEAVRNQIAGL
ncbi:MAG: hypothetical protein WC107_02750 [Patescibacteria group bacterium]